MAQSEDWRVSTIARDPLCHAALADKKSQVMYVDPWPILIEVIKILLRTIHNISRAKRN